jgi:hypothetical protein
VPTTNFTIYQHYEPLLYTPVYFDRSVISPSHPEAHISLTIRTLFESNVFLHFLERKPISPFDCRVMQLMMKIYTQEYIQTFAIYSNLLYIQMTLLTHFALLLPKLLYMHHCYQNVHVYCVWYIFWINRLHTVLCIIQCAIKKPFFGFMALGRRRYPPSTNLTDRRKSKTFQTWFS